MRNDVDDAVEVFRAEVVPRLQEHEGYEGALVLTTPDGAGILLTVWDTAEAADRSSAFAAEQLERYMTLFRAPPGREHYEIAYLDLPGVAVG
jgi:hypothetical protein